MRCAGLMMSVSMLSAFIFSGACPVRGAGAASPAAESKAQDSDAAIVVGHPFTAVKYARLVRVLPGGKQQFIRNERYPVQIARDADGRVMMQGITSDDLLPECDRLELRIPPICPVWSIFVFDPIAQTISHWNLGERAGRGAVEFPLTEAHLEEAAQATADLPGLPPDFSDEEGKVSTVDLGDETIEGIEAHGVRWTLRSAKAGRGGTIYLTRIHEVWRAPSMKLIVRVVDGDPSGVETVWGIEKVSLSSDPSLFLPPAGYEIQQRNSDKFAAVDLECIDSWFVK